MIVAFNLSHSISSIVLDHILSFYYIIRRTHFHITDLEMMGIYFQDQREARLRLPRL